MWYSIWHLESADKQYSRIYQYMNCIDIVLPSHHSVPICKFSFSNRAWCRLYWYPLKVLHSTNWGVYLYHLNKDPKMYLVLNILLFLLQMLHIYWFYVSSFLFCILQH